MQRPTILAAIAFSLAGVSGCQCGCWKNCPPQNDGPDSEAKRQGQDQIQLTMTGTDSATIVLDGRRTANCDVKDEEGRTATQDNKASLDNLLTPSSCSSNLAVFAKDNAMRFGVENRWRDTPGDVIDITMTKRELLPLAIWMVSGEASDSWYDVEAARQIFNDMQAGIDFDPLSITPAPSGTSDLQTAGCQQSTVDDLKNRVGFASNRLNVYYVSEITDGVNRPTGKFCDETKPKVILIRVDAVKETLGHEVGHALSLVHTNPPDVVGIPADNLMLQLSTNLNSLTTGQSFRANLTPDSAINSGAGFGGSRTGLVRPCNPISKSDDCPEVTFDVMPK